MLKVPSHLDMSWLRLVEAVLDSVSLADARGNKVVVVIENCPLRY